jgi:hypothetical protein
MIMKKTVLALECTFLTALTLTVVGFAGEAVSQKNGKIEALGGQIDGDAAGNLAGSYTLPLSSDFGLQLDGLLGRLDKDDLYATGGHLFWRDSEKALAGLTAAYARLGTADIWRFGAEGELYWNDLTFAGQFGNQAGDLGDANYIHLDARYYLFDNNMMLAGGGGYFDDKAMVFGDVEYYTGWKGLSLFASGGVGQKRFDYLVGGVRYYFGADKSLKQRHREDDPPNNLFYFVNDSATAFMTSSFSSSQHSTTTSGGGGTPPSPGTEQTPE